MDSRIREYNGGSLGRFIDLLRKESREVTVTLPREAIDFDRDHNLPLFELRVWEGREFGRLTRGHADAGSAKSKLLLDMRTSDREFLADFLTLFLGRPRVAEGKYLGEETDVWDV
ncbi:MAG: hypothetical protein WC531_01815 [Candidatus Paceibacterota bacterium]|jgi:hypothetical protein